MATKRSTDKTAQERELGQMIGEVSRAWRYELNQRLKPLGLNQSMQQVLTQLHRNPQGLMQRELARRLGIEGATLVRLLDLLEQRALIKRIPAPDDKRMKYAVLTAKATSQIHLIETVLGDLRTEMMQGLAKDDIRTGLAIMQHMHRNLCEISD